MNQLPVATLSMLGLFILKKDARRQAWAEVVKTVRVRISFSRSTSHHNNYCVSKPGTLMFRPPPAINVVKAI